MSDKMPCPGCDGYSSSILAKVAEGEPCPFCGLSASAVLEISTLRRKQADEELKTRLETALVELDRMKTEAAELRRQVSRARLALGCTGHGETGKA